MADTLASRAVRLYNDRRRRAEFFPENILSDHGWDLLLWLFIETERGRRVSISDAARAIRSSAQSAGRWIAALQTMALIDFRSSEESVILADDGRRRMVEFLTDVV
jgi:hypothetical protein